MPREQSFSEPPADDRTRRELSPPVLALSPPATLLFDKRTQRLPDDPELDVVRPVFSIGGERYGPESLHPSRRASLRPADDPRYKVYLGNARLGQRDLVRTDSSRFHDAQRDVARRRAGSISAASGRYLGLRPSVGDEEFVFSPGTMYQVRFA
jgi:hypothetical protein